MNWCCFKFLLLSAIIVEKLKAEVTIKPIKPNIVLLVVDDLRPALGVYGSKNAFTPNIDGLAASSFVFNNAFAQQALCAPSRISFLTSRRPDSLRLYDFYSYWRDTVGNFTTIPQHFKENGYYTLSLGKVFHPGPSSNFTDDFPYSWSAPPFHPKTEIYKEAKVCVNHDGSLARNLICPVAVERQPDATLPDLETVAAAMQFLDNHVNITNNLPFFVAVGLHKPHIPLKFPQEYLDFHPIDNVTLPRNRWRPSSLPLVAWNPWSDVRNRDDIEKLNLDFPFGDMPEAITRKIIQSYNAATTYIDDLIGQLLSKINKNNTLIVLTSDHGWSLGEHGEFAKYSNFDIVTKVPLIIHLPGPNNKQKIMNEIVELVDLFPTLVEITKISSNLERCLRNGSNAKLCTEGRSLLPSMLKKSIARKAIFTQYPRPGIFPTLIPNSDAPRLLDIRIMGYSIRTKRHRYTEWVKFNNTSFQPDWQFTLGRELYDHLIDPDENLNLANRPELKRIVSSLRKQLILGWRYT